MIVNDIKKRRIEQEIQRIKMHYNVTKQKPVLTTCRSSNFHLVHTVYDGEKNKLCVIFGANVQLIRLLIQILT